MMNNLKLTIFKNLIRTSIWVSLAVISNLSLSAPLNISNNPLEIATGVEPNVMVLNDDSGSMDWSLLIDGDEDGIYHINVAGATGNGFFGTFYFYTVPDGDNADGNNNGLPTLFTLPTQNLYNALDADFDLDARGFDQNWKGVWRNRLSNYNKLYYNPNVEYIPWKGVDDAGNTYTNSNPNNARVDPFLSGGSTINLTNDLNFVAITTNPTNVGALAGWNDTMYPARYYTWVDDSNTGGATPGNNVVDVDDTHTLIQIRTGGGCNNGATCPTSFVRQGTRTDCGGDGLETSSVVCTPEQELQNFANYYTYYRRRELTAKAAITTVLEPVSEIRVGMATINNVANNRIQVDSLNLTPKNGTKKTLFDRIFQTQAGGRTPLRQNLQAVGEYFSCNNGNIFGTGSSSPGNPNCPVQASPAGECQQNYTILITDGFWNENDPNVGNADGDGQDGGTPQGPFDQASFADNFNNTLADVAMHYYERDLHSSLDDGVPTTVRDKNRYNGTTDPFDTMHQHMSTYTIGIGVKGALPVNPDDIATNPAEFTFNASTVTGWPDPLTATGGKIDDLRHAAWNARGDFLSASDQTELTNSLQVIFDEIQSGKGAASAVAFNSQDLQSGARVFRALFNANQNTGSLIAQEISITGVISPTQIWNAGELLDSKASTSSDTRNIISYDSNTFTGIPFQWASLNTTQQNLLKSPTIANNPPTPNQLGENRLNYLRGQSENEGKDFDAGDFRKRVTDDSGRRLILGDIIHSAPVFVGIPPFTDLDQAPFPDTTGNLYSEFATTFNSRRETVYVGANDGMMHAFDANSGEEIFAFVPNSVLNSVTQLTDPNYSHRYFVDMTPAINDVYITPTNGTNSGVASWNTVAVTGLGIGAPGYFALNLTNPADLATEASAATNVMWEFTQADDVGSGATNNNLNLGSHIREPVIVMTNIDGANGQKRWAAIFGNGYNSASSDGNAELYILFLDGGLDGTWTRGSDFVKLNTNNGKAQSSDGTTPNGLGAVQAIDIDGNGTADVVYAGDYQGNLYRFNISSTTVSGLNNSSNRPVQQIFQARYNSASGPIQPITNRPAVVKHPTQDGYIVIIGTGSYFTVDDTTNTDIQSIYGIWDDFVNASDNAITVTYNKLLEQVFTTTGVVNSLTTRNLSNLPINYGGSTKGWVIDLDVVNGGSVEFPGERAVRNILIRGDSAFVNTIIPKSSTSCSVGPGSFTISFKTENGGGGTSPVFDTNNDGIFDSDDNIGAADGESNVVAAIRSDKTTLTDSSTIGNRLVSQGGDQSISSIGINPKLPSGSDTLGRHSWREIEN